MLDSLRIQLSLPSSLPIQIRNVDGQGMEETDFGWGWREEEDLASCSWIRDLKETGKVWDGLEGIGPQIRGTEGGRELGAGEDVGDVFFMLETVTAPVVFGFLQEDFKGSQVMTLTAP